MPSAYIEPPEIAEQPSVEPQVDPAEEQRKNEIMEFNSAKPYLQELERGFAIEVERATANRERRKVDIDIEALRKSGKLKQSDILVPMRVIDENIAREKPAYIAYLQQSRRLAIFADVQDPQIKHDDLESAFTRGMTYPGWIVSHHKAVDGAQLHGWDWYEVLYDASKPLHCGIEHVGHDRLEYSLDGEDIQNNQRIARVFKWTRAQIDQAVADYDFSPAQAEKLLAINTQVSSNSGSIRDHVYTIKKGYAKYKGVVYVYWYSLVGCDDWLLAPRPFYNGVDQEVTVLQPQPPIVSVDPMTGMPSVMEQPPLEVKQWEPVEETEYPVKLLPYEETEEKEISTRKGRAFKDKFKQEVMTVGWSGFLNGHNRATWLIGSKSQQDGKPASELQNIELKDGAIIPTSIDWRSMPYPDPSMLQGLQLFDTKNAQSQGQMTYAVQNKSAGARTTATEVESAKQDTALIGSVSVTLFSSAMRDVYTAAWRIVQSQALQDKVEFYGGMEQIQNPQTGEVEYNFVNNKDVIKRRYDIRPAGDTDVVQRQELLGSMMEFWPVVQNTPIAGEFLAELLKIKFAERGDIWAKKLQEGDIKTQLLQQYMQILTSAMQNPGELASLDAAAMGNLQQLVATTQQALMPPGNPAQQEVPSEA